jgi:hypothetical protein
LKSAIGTSKGRARGTSGKSGSHSDRTAHRDRAERGRRSPATHVLRAYNQILTGKAESGINALLAEGNSIADASTWADKHRRQLPNTAPWHYADVPLDEKYDPKWSGDDPKKGCVVEKIKEFRATLKDTSKTVEEKRFALRFLIHCIEDMHMPMHIGNNHDRGGNDTQVRFFDRGTNMHSLWDTGMIERVSRSKEIWIADLAKLPSSQSQDRTAEGTVEDWATESVHAARTTSRRLASESSRGRSWASGTLRRISQSFASGSIKLASGWRRY